jgi:hypothetical protein
MASVELREGDVIASASVKKLAREAARLNERLGDPARVAGAR